MCNNHPLIMVGCFGGKSEQTKEQMEASKAIEKMLEKDKHKYKSTHRLLLLGEYLKAFLSRNSHDSGVKHSYCEPDN